MAISLVALWNSPTGSMLMTVRTEDSFLSGYQGLISFAHGCVCFTCPGCSQGVWNSACWQVSLTFLYLGRLLVFWGFTESSFFLRIFLRGTTSEHNSEEISIDSQTQCNIQRVKHDWTELKVEVTVSCFFNFQSLSVLCASDGHGQWMDELWSMSACQRVWACSSASHQGSAPGHAVWPGLGTALNCTAPFSSATTTRPGWVSAKAMPTSRSPTICQHGPAACDPQTERRRLRRTEQPVAVVLCDPVSRCVPWENGQCSHTGSAVVSTL